MPQLYALDHNFPPLAATTAWPPDLNLVPIRELSEHLVRLTDWQLIEELQLRGNVTGLITIDARMLNQPKEMVALSRSNLTLIVTDGAGNNALRGTGLLMVHMPGLLQHSQRPPRVLGLRPGTVTTQSADRQLNLLSAQRNIAPPELISQALDEMERARRDSR